MYIVGCTGVSKKLLIEENPNQNWLLWGPIFPWAWIRSTWSRLVLVRNGQKKISRHRGCRLLKSLCVRRQQLWQESSSSSTFQAAGELEQEEGHGVLGGIVVSQSALCALSLCSSPRLGQGLFELFPCFWIAAVSRFSPVSRLHSARADVIACTGAWGRKLFQRSWRAAAVAVVSRCRPLRLMITTILLMTVNTFAQGRYPTSGFSLPSYVIY